MKWLRSLARAVGVLLRIILRDGWIAIGAICREIAAILRGRRPRRPGREDRVSQKPCEPIHEPAFKRPDPMIYSQGYLMAQGLAVTWDNPDIVLRRNGSDVPSSSLLPDTEYDVVARVWNNSTEAPVVDLPVVFSFLHIGVATAPQAIGKAKVNLGVKGGPNHPAFVTATWRTPTTPGHYCIQVLLDWFDDANPNNNLGQENTLVGIATSPATFVFTLRNDTDARQAFRFEVDTYTIPEPPRCPPDRPIVNDHNTVRGAGHEPRPVPPLHDRRQYPVPEGWLADLDPGQPVLEPGAEVAVTARITPPGGFHGRRSFNVNAFHASGLAGGVTLVVDAS
jgi:hypothetical protein